jgi:hypothetical protein
MTKHTQRPIPPLPEAIPARRDRWKVGTAAPVPGQPCTSIFHRTMSVPLGDDDVSFAIRIHEMAHAKYGPVALGDPENIATQPTVAAVEEARVNALVNAVGAYRDDDGKKRYPIVSDLRFDAIDYPLYANAVTANDYRALARNVVAAVCSARWQTFAEYAKANPGPMTQWAQSIAKVPQMELHSAASFDLTLKIARWLDAVLDAIDARRAADPTFQPDGELDRASFDPTAADGGAAGIREDAGVADADADGDGDGDGEAAGDGEPDPDGEEAAPTAGGKADPGERHPHKVGRTAREEKRGVWGPMRIEEPRRVLAIPGAVARKRRASEEGDIPLRFDRLPIDGAVFVRNRRAPGGAVLIDASGSMAFTPADVDAIVQALPGATVAMYSGTSYKGVLTLLAKNGRRVADVECKPRYDGNCVDGPALEWLAKQPGPRVWYSDGQVVGSAESIDASEAPNLYRECARICARARIVRVDQPRSGGAGIPGIIDSLMRRQP